MEYYRYSASPQPSIFSFVLLGYAYTAVEASNKIAVPTDTVPAFPIQITAKPCRLDLSDELFGGVKDACSKNLDRSRCCPVLAAWLYAAHARSSLQIDRPQSNDNDGLPTMPEDSQNCVDSLHTSLAARHINIISPNGTCDAISCFCGIRLHNITSLHCPAAFDLSGNSTASPTHAVKDLEINCKNSSYSGCTRCLGALQKVKGQGKNSSWGAGGASRTRKMMERDCQLMGLTWLLTRNRTAYIPTVSAVLRAMTYSPRSTERGRCSPDQENMPLAVDSAELVADDAAAGRLSASLSRVGASVLLVACAAVMAVG